MGSVALCCVNKALQKITSSADLTSKLLLALARTGYKSSQWQHYVNVTPEQEGKLIKCLVARCFATMCIFGRAVPVKGADEDDYAACLVTNAVVLLGHLEVIMRGDTD